MFSSFVIRHSSLIRLPIALALFVVIFLYGGVYTFSYQESLGTYYATSTFVDNALSTPGGVAQLISAWLTQYFASPYTGMVIMSLLLTALAWIAGEVAVCLSKVGRLPACDNAAAAPSTRQNGAPWLRWLGLLPAVSLALLNYNVNYSNSGTVALLLMFAFLWTSIRLLDAAKEGRLPACDNTTSKNNVRKFLAALAVLSLTALLSYTCSSVAVLFGVLLCISGIGRSFTRAAFGLLCAAVAVLCAWIYVRQGFYGSLAQAASPLAYFTLRLKFGAFVYTPWILSAAIVIIAVVVSKLPKPGRVASLSLGGAGMLAAVVYGVVGCAMSVSPDNERFKQLMHYAGRSDWDAIIDLCADRPVTNILHQNIYNMALAERGMLADCLFLSPCVDIRNIYIEGDKTPYMQALLSDIYYSMGHIALAQRNAFEANESLGNLSPRLLSRLAQTNLVYGHYDVAERYIRLLEATRNYRAQAAHWRTLLYNDAAVEADHELGPKRRCIFPDNRFSAWRGLDDDLRQIARVNPDHRATLQYLGALYLLSKDVPKFAGVIDEFYPAGSALPEAFAEAMTAAYSDKADSIAARYRMPDGVADRYSRFLRDPNSQRPTFWYFYNFQQ